MNQNTSTDHDDLALRETPLHAVHVELGARLVPFAGFEMPIQYTGIIDEHMAVRERVGCFDVSHMGEIFVSGDTAFDFVQHLVSNDVSTLYDGRAQYNVMCTADAGIVDDLLVYRLSQDRYMLVVNAACAEKDIAWMHEQNGVGATIDDASDRIALIAVQGPNAFATVDGLFPISPRELKFYHFARLEPGTFFGCDFALLSRTGYTGEAGVEIYCDADRAPEVWNAVMDAGHAFGIQPIGLGARDTLRLEAGYCLYGNDITNETSPLEAGLDRFVKLEKGSFVGRDALVASAADGPSRKLVGFVALERGIPRHGDPISAPDGREIGRVTSGTQSPVLRKGIGLGYVEADDAFTRPGSRLNVISRGRPIPVEVRTPPFHKDV
jgi:aminomethyltransferase